MSTREPVKSRKLTRRETNLERLRSECSERLAKDRESLLHRLRGGVDTATLIRESINSVRSLSSSQDDADSVRDPDIDRLVSEFIREFRHETEDLAFPYPDEFEYDDEVMGQEITSGLHWHKDWIKCPVCADGWLVVPVPGVIACDACELKTRLPSEHSTEQDFALCLDRAIQAHSQCGGFKIAFTFENGVLFSQCARCGVLPVVVFP